MDKCLMKVSAVSVISLLSAAFLACYPALSTTLQFDDGATLLIPGENVDNGSARDYRTPQASIKGSKVYGHDFDGNEIGRLAKEGIKIGQTSKSNFLDLKEGSVLFSPDKRIIIGTESGNLTINPGAAVFLINSTKGFVLYDLRQNMPKQVSLSIGDEDLFPLPGHMLVVSNENESNFENLDLNCHAVPYGKAQKILIPKSDASKKELKVFIAGFSVSEAFLVLEPLKQLIASSNKQDKLLLERILKSAASSRDFLEPLPPSQLANRSRQL